MGGGVEFDVVDHRRTGFVGRGKIIHRGEVIELALDRVRGDRMRHLAGGVLVGAGQIGEHTAEKGDVGGPPAIENTIRLGNHFLGQRRFGVFLGLLAVRLDVERVPMAVDQLGKTCQFVFGEEQKILRLALVVELHADGGERLADGIVGRRAAKGEQHFGQACQDFFSPQAQMRRRDQTAFPEKLAYRALLRL